MTTLIIGGAGYIGSHVAKALALEEEDTIVLDNLSTGHRSAVKWSKFVYGDTRNLGDLDRVFSSYPIQKVMHLGDLSTVHESNLNPSRYYNNNVYGLINILTSMIKNGVTKIVYSSTAAVYGNSHLKSIPESSDLSPINTYGKSKLMGELILEDFYSSHGISSVCLRYFNAAGADLDTEIGENHENETHLIPNVLMCLLNSQDGFQLYGNDYPTLDGTCIRDYVHVTDIANAHLLAAQHLESFSGCKKYNLGSESGFSVLEVLEACKEVTGYKPHYTVSPRRCGDPAVLVADSKKIRRELYWNPAFSDLKMIIKSAWKWHLKLANASGTDEVA